VPRKQNDSHVSPRVTPTLSETLHVNKNIAYEIE